MIGCRQFESLAVIVRHFLWGGQRQAVISAAIARFGTNAHVTGAFAALCAGAANLRTQTAGRLVLRGVSHHEVCGDIAGLDAIQHDRNMGKVAMFSANFQKTAGQRLGAHACARMAFLDAGF